MQKRKSKANLDLDIPGLPGDVLETYARLWQFETWMRRLVYVHLRALDGDAWEGKIRAELAKKPKGNDKELTHMPTPEDDVLSFVQVSELKRIVSENWSLFESYFPPHDLWMAKIQEVLAIRHRVAHFRTLHQDDLYRVKLFLRDIDQGFWRFCTSFNDSHSVLPQSGDPVVYGFIDKDPFPWTEIKEKTWARVGSVNRDERLVLQIEVIALPWSSWNLPIAGKPGFLYDVMIYARGQANLDYKRLLAATKTLHEHVAYICLDNESKSFRVTIPACLGADVINPVVAAFYDAALNNLRPWLGDVSSNAVQALADAQPEYVLGPDNPLTFLDPDMHCSFFGCDL